MFYSLAAANGSNDGRKNKDILEEVMTPSQIQEAQKLAREWMRTHK